MTPVMDGSIQEDDHLVPSRHDGVRLWVLTWRPLLSRLTPTREVLMAPDPQPTWPLARTLAWVVLAVMTVALAYTGWIAIANFNRIGV